jgi:DNA-binding transcriptional LysR family regulator
MLDRLTSMSVFICAAEQRSFAVTANLFGISPTMVGKHIRSLEERIGAKLLNRTTRQQSLTEVGQIYYERCKRILADAEAADACAADLRVLPRGRLKIHSPVSFGTQRLAPALVRYLQRHPQVDVELTLADRAVDLVEEGYEAAIRIGNLPDSGLIARELRPYTMWLCAAPSYLATTGVPHTAEELANHNCLGFAYWRRRDVWRLRKAEQTESVRVKGQLLANNGQALRMAALEGLGIILQPEVLVREDVTSGRLIRLLTDYEPPPRPMSLVYVADRRPTPKLKSFIEFIVETFGLNSR